MLGLEGHAEPGLDFTLTIHAQAGDCPETPMTEVSVGLVELWCVEQVEEIATEPYLNALGNGEGLAYIQVHIFRTRAREWISRASTRSDRNAVDGCYRAERRRVKPVARTVDLMQRPNQVGSGTGTVAILASDIKRKATGESQNGTELPSAQERIGSRVPVMAEGATATEWQFVESVEYKPMANVEIGVGALLGLPIKSIDLVAAITVIVVETRFRVVNGMRPGISGGELNPAGEVPLYLRVQTVVNGIATGVIDRYRAQQRVGFVVGRGATVIERNHDYRTDASAADGSWG